MSDLDRKGRAANATPSSTTTDSDNVANPYEPGTSLHETWKLIRDTSPLITPKSDRLEHFQGEPDENAISPPDVNAQALIGVRVFAEDVQDDLEEVSVSAISRADEAATAKTEEPLESVDGAILLDDLASFWKRFVVVSESELVVAALWIVHTWAFAASETTPYLHISSAEKRSGKSRFLEVAALLCHAPLQASSATAAAVFRSLGGEHPPTLLLDEVDAIFGKDGTEELQLRKVLNAGFRYGAKVLRTNQEKEHVDGFEVYSPKLLAGIGDLPDTVADRSLRIRMKRKTRDERVERFSVRRPPEEAEDLRLRSEEWARQNMHALMEAQPDVLNELDDRAWDVVEPLLAIADLAGGNWPTRARDAVIELRNGAEPDNETIRAQLLRNIRTVFETLAVDRIHTVDLLSALCADDEAPWSDWYGKPLNAHKLGHMLHEFGIRSRDVRIDGGKNLKGYLREQFEDAWNRYAPSPASQSATPRQTASLQGKQTISKRDTNRSVADSKSTANPHGYGDVAVVALSKPDTGAGNGNGQVNRVPLGKKGYLEYIEKRRDAGDLSEAEYKRQWKLHYQTAWQRFPRWPTPLMPDPRTAVVSAAA